MTIQESIKSINGQARKVFGADTSILVARAPAFGNDDTCIIVSGKRHAEAAMGFATIKGAKLKTEIGHCFIDDTEYTFTTVTI